MEKRVDLTKQKLNDCRLCFSSTNVTVHIGQHIDKNVSIVEKIQYCTSLIVHVGDDFPQKICITCAENLDLVYNFKSKAIACDMELSSNVYLQDINFTYTQVSDDPSNMTYKLYLEEENPSTIDTNSKIIVHIDNNVSMIKEITNNDGKKSIEKRLNGNSDFYQSSKTNNKKKSTLVDLKRNSDKSLFENYKHNSKQMKIENEKPLVIVKNDKVVYNCGECNFETDTMMRLVSHRARFHLDLDNFKGLDCSTYYKSPGMLKQHIPMPHRVKSYIRTYCKRRYSTKPSFDRHLKYHQSETPLEFQCVKYNAYSDTIDKMEDHYASSSNKLRCEHRKYKFLTYAPKKKHNNFEHLIEIECGICHVVLPTEEAMDKHNSSVH